MSITIIYKENQAVEGNFVFNSHTSFSRFLDQVYNPYTKPQGQPIKRTVTMYSVFIMRPFK